MGSFDAFRYRDYRLLWIGAVLSNTGTWMQTIALGWYVFQLTHSAFWVSFITFINFIPIVLSPLGGVYTDRLDRKKILLGTQVIMMLDATVLAILAWTGHANLATVMILTFGQGLMIAFNGPTWMAFVTSLVPPKGMVNAIALNSAQFNLARVIGPAIGGVIIGLSSRGPAIVFTFNAASFVAVLIALALIRSHPRPQREARGLWELLVGGLSYTMRNERIRAMIVSIGIMSFLAAPASALLPIFAADVFHRGAGSYGSLAAAAGLGSVGGALLLGRLGNRISPVVVAEALVGVGLCLILFGAIPVYPAGLLLIFLYGVVFLLFVSGNNSDVQLQVEEPMRGRVLSIWMLALGVSLPVGSLLAGVAAEAWGAPATTIAGGIGCALWGLAMLRRFRGPATQTRFQPSAEPLT
jgi:MFS family permease